MLGYNSWEDYHERGAIPNVWKGMTGQLSNEVINKQNMDYAREMTLAQWERDDTAYQRAVADAEAAGLSPLAISGGASNTPAVTDGPMNAVASGNINPFQFVEGIMNAFTSRDRLSFDKEEAEKTHDETAKQLANTAEEIGALVESNKIKSEEVKNNLLIAQQTLQFQQDNLEYLKAKHLDEYSWQQTVEASKTFQQGIMERYKDYPGTFKPCYTPEEYKSAVVEYEKVVKEMKKELIKKGFDSGSGSLNIFGLGGGSFSAGADVTEIQKAVLDEYLPKLKIPIAVSENDRQFIDENGNFRMPTRQSALETE